MIKKLPDVMLDMAHGPVLIGGCAHVKLVVLGLTAITKNGELSIREGGGKKRSNLDFFAGWLHPNDRAAHHVLDVLTLVRDAAPWTWHVLQKLTTSIVQAAQMARAVHTTIHKMTYDDVFAVNNSKPAGHTPDEVTSLALVNVKLASRVHDQSLLR